MKRLFILIIIAIIANSLTVYLYADAADQPGGTGALMEFVFILIPFIWGITFLIAVILAIIWRKKLFNKIVAPWTILTLVFCTPVPAIGTYKVTHPRPETQRSSTWMKTVNGQVHIKENWYYTSNRKTYLKKYFVADSVQERSLGDAAYKRDSIWIYLASNGDTIKIEQYRRGTLLSSVSKKK
jgi:hypothetical protein